MRPGKLRANVQAECFAFEGESQERRAVPRGPQASRGLANKVVAQHKDIASMLETQPFSLLLGGTPIDPPAGWIGFRWGINASLLRATFGV